MFVLLAFVALMVLACAGCLLADYTNIGAGPAAFVRGTLPGETDPS